LGGIVKPKAYYVDSEHNTIFDVMKKYFNTNVTPASRVYLLVFNPNLKHFRGPLLSFHKSGHFSQWIFCSTLFVIFGQFEEGKIRNNKYLLLKK